MGEKRRGKEKEREKIFALLGKFLLSCDIVFSQKCFFGKILGIKLGKTSRKTPKNRCQTAKIPQKLHFWGK